MRYDYDIQTEKLNPPIGGTYHYVAKVGNLVRLKENALGEQVAHSLGEAWGTTQDDAIQKMERVVKYWIDQRSEHYEDCPGCKLARSLEINNGFAIPLKPPYKATCAKCEAEFTEETAHLINGRAYTPPVRP